MWSGPNCPLEGPPLTLEDPSLKPQLANCSGTLVWQVVTRNLHFSGLVLEACLIDLFRGYFRLTMRKKGWDQVLPKDGLIQV